jgi:hypothetical protein
VRQRVVEADEQTDLIVRGVQPFETVDDRLLPRAQHDQIDPVS